MNWISVKDRLPEIGKKIIIYYRRELRTGTESEVERAIFYGDSFDIDLGCQCCRLDNIALSDVLYWIPMPTAPDQVPNWIPK